MAKNSYYVELKRYLAEVSVGARTLMLPTLAERVDKAYQNGVGTLDICELFSQYALSSAKLSKQTKNYFAKSEKFLKEHRAIERAQRGLSLDNLQTTYPIKKIPYVPNAVKGRPFTRYTSEKRPSPIDNDREVSRFLDEKLKKLR